MLLRDVSKIIIQMFHSHAEYLFSVLPYVPKNAIA